MQTDGMTSGPLSEWLKDTARRNGFELAGLTSPDPPPHLDVFSAWLQAGRHGEMGYLATERAREARADLHRLLPECRSVLVLGARYGSAQEPAPPAARVAAYAVGDDYHTVLIARAEAVIDELRSRLGQAVAYRAYTDTGPLLERELAQRAGLGWIGRNTCLIHPRLGSRLLLVEILLALDLVADRPFTQDRCGTCRRCLDACPTGCILPDRTLDATRCISYLTIETRGPIPADLRPRTGSWMFGCDVCQDVCPWNVRFHRASTDPAFAPRPGLASPDPQAWLTLPAEDFAASLRRSPLKRPGRAGLARNAAVVLGNLGREADVNALGQALRQDPSAVVRGHAAWALGRIGSPTARGLLEQALGREAEADVRAEIGAALVTP